MKKNPVYFNAAIRLFGGETNFSCNAVVNEVKKKEFDYYGDLHYTIPEVREYKRMLGIGHNDGIHFPRSFFDSEFSPTEYDSSPQKRLIRTFTLLLAYESGVGVRPSDVHSLDRIDSGLGYYKDNCRWATKDIQSFNQKLSVDNKSGITGVQYREEFGTYRIYITKNGKRIHLGSTSDFFLACCVRKSAENLYYNEIKNIKENI